MNILFLAPYPLNESPSQRFRFEQYFELLGKEGHSYHVQSFLNDQKWRRFSAPGNIIFKCVALLKGFLRRSLIMFTLHKYNLIFVHREAAPLGPPVFEWLVARIFRKKMIYDFDDAIWMADKDNESLIKRIAKWRRKVPAICKWSYKVSCGNAYLCQYALQFNKRVIYNPTTIDTVSLHNPQLFFKEPADSITIGWTGSNSTLKYLKPLEAILARLERSNPSIQFMVIADQMPSLTLSRVIFRCWNIDTEIDDLARFDIGIMPLPDDEWAKGKCAFKALQYMALGIPTVASPVGANTSVIDHGVNGFLASTPAEWESCLLTLIGNKALRASIGRNGRQKVIDQYSVLSNAARFLSLIE